MQSRGPRRAGAWPTDSAGLDGGETRRVGSLLVRSTAVNYATTFLVYAIGFLASPYFIHTLGRDAYGLSTLPQVFSLAGWGSILEAGIALGLVRGVAAAAARNNWTEVSRLTSTGFAVFAVVGVVACGALVAAAPWLVTGVFHVHGAHRSALIAGFRLLGVVLAVQFPLLSVVALVEGLQRVDVYLLTRFLGALITVGAGLAVVAFGGGLYGYVLTLVVGPASGSVLLLGWWLTHRHPHVRFSYRHVSRDSGRILRGLTGGVFVTRIIEVVYSNTDRIVIGVSLAAAALTDYAIAIKLYSVVYTVSILMQGAVVAAASHYAAAQDLPRLRELFLRGCRYAATVSLPPAIVLLVLSRPVVDAWVGSSYGGAVVPLRIVLAHLFVSSFLGVSSMLLIATGNVRLLVRYTGVSAVLNLAISIATVHVIGISGVMLGTAVGYAAVSPLVVAQLLRILGLRWRDLWRGLCVPVYPWVVAAGIAALLELELAHPRSAGAVIAAIVGPVVLGVAGIVLVGLNKAERRQLLGLVRTSEARA